MGRPCQCCFSCEEGNLAYSIENNGSTSFTKLTKPIKRDSSVFIFPYFEKSLMIGSIVSQTIIFRQDSHEGEEKLRVVIDRSKDNGFPYIGGNIQGMDNNPFGDPRVRKNDSTENFLRDISDFYGDHYQNYLLQNRDKGKLSKVTVLYGDNEKTFYTETEYSTDSQYPVLTFILRSSGLIISQKSPYNHNTETSVLFPFVKHKDNPDSIERTHDHLTTESIFCNLDLDNVFLELILEHRGAYDIFGYGHTRVDQRDCISPRECSFSPSYMTPMWDLVDNSEITNIEGLKVERLNPDYNTPVYNPFFGYFDREKVPYCFEKRWTFCKNRFVSSVINPHEYDIGQEFPQFSLTTKSERGPDTLVDIPPYGLSRQRNYTIVDHWTYGPSNNDYPNRIVDIIVKPSIIDENTIKIDVSAKYEFFLIDSDEELEFTFSPAPYFGDPIIGPTEQLEQSIIRSLPIYKTVVEAEFTQNIPRWSGQPPILNFIAASYNITSPFPFNKTVVKKVNISSEIVPPPYTYVPGTSTVRRVSVSPGRIKGVFTIDGERFIPSMINFSLVPSGDMDQPNE